MRPARRLRLLLITAPMPRVSGVRARQSVDALVAERVAEPAHAFRQALG